MIVITTRKDDTTTLLWLDESGENVQSEVRLFCGGLVIQLEAGALGFLCEFGLGLQISARELAQKIRQRLHQAGSPEHSGINTHIRFRFALLLW